MLDGALALAARGWRVFPCEARGKVPITKNGVKDATDDPAQIVAWWTRTPDANIGLACGLEVVVVDFDGDELPDVPHTLTVKTGRGRHIYLDPCGETYTNRAHLSGLAVDVRGAGGYVIAPPSVHPSGLVYEWAVEAPLAPVPQAWRSVMLKALPVGPAPVIPRGPVGDAFDRARRYLAAIPPAVSGAGGHAQTFMAASAMVLGFDLSEADALTLMTEYNARCQPPWSAKELAHKVRSAASTGTMQRGSLLHAQRERAPMAARDATLPDYLRVVPPIDDEWVPCEQAETPAPTAAPAAEKPKAERKKKPKPAPTMPGLGSSHEAIRRHVFAHLAQIHGPLVFDEGSFYGYSNGAWTAIPSRPDVWAAVQNLDGEVPGDDTGPIRVTAGMVDSVVALGAASLTRQGFFAAAPPGLSFSDGFLSVVDGGLRLVPHHPEQRCRFRYDFAYEDAMNAPCPRWLKALGEWGFGPEAEEEFIARWTGATLLGLITSDPKALILVGDGGEGKSQCIGVIEGLFDVAWRSHVPLQAMAGPFAAADLVGIRLNTVGDASKAEFTDTARFKNITGGEPIRAERKYKDAFTFRPGAGHIFSFNELPRIADDSTGIWRRLAVVRFTRPRHADAERVPDLARLILAEERIGVVGWALAGAARFLAARGWPAISTDAAEEWRMDSNPVALWREERTAAGGWTDAKTLYADFKTWAGANGFFPPSSTTFGTRLKRLLGPNGTKRSNGTRYAVELREGPRWF